jgi:hypothetical protein
MLAWLVGDTRLFGLWRSDRERTIAEWPFAPDATSQQREQLARIFGKLEIRYGRWRFNTTFEGQTSPGWYRVLAKDADSVMVESWLSSPPDGRERTLSHIHFTGDHYWMTLGESTTREFFRRVE